MEANQPPAIRLDDLIDAEELQSLADALSALAQVPIYFARADGRLITSLKYVHATCAAVATANGAERPCAQCPRRELTNAGADWPSGPVSEMLPCPSGLVDVVVPVRAGGVVLGLIGTSQFRADAAAAESVRDVFRAVGANDIDVETLLAHTSEIGAERLPQIQGATATVARVVARLAQLRLEAERGRERAEHLMRTDPLTDIENRRQAMRAIDEVVSLAVRHGRPFAFVMADIDHFKSVNDDFGHAKGDEVLISFAVLATSKLRASDRVYRIGGEEFLVVCRETTWEGARVLAERIRGSLEENDFRLGDDRRVTASFGVYAWDLACGDPPDGEQALRRADEALYEAKRRGRNQVVSAPIGSVAAEA